MKMLQKCTNQEGKDSQAVTKGVITSLFLTNTLNMAKAHAPFPSNRLLTAYVHNEPCILSINQNHHQHSKRQEKNISELIFYYLKTTIHQDALHPSLYPPPRSLNSLPLPPMPPP